MSRILKLDAAGTPQAWVPARDAAVALARGIVLWTVGGTAATLRGGMNRNGVRSRMDIPAIIAVQGEVFTACHDHENAELTRDMVFKRDRNLCAYCGQVFDSADLSLDHVIPVSRGGPTSWTNLVTADRACNSRKANRTPDEAGMPLLYVPYAPNLHEKFILAELARRRTLLADQMSFLLAKVARDSRLRQ